MEQFEQLKNLVISKLDKDSDLSWEDICNILDLDLNPHELRKRSYGIKAYDDYLKSKSISQVSSSDIQNDIDLSDEIDIDLNQGKIYNKTKDKEYSFSPYPKEIQKLIEVGGLVEYTKQKKDNQ